MMCRNSIFALLAAGMTFAAGGITVNGSVDSHIELVTLQGGNQNDSINRNGSKTWSGWSAGVAYTVSASNVDAGYTAKWKVTTNNVVALSGGMNNTITLSSAFNNCSLSFYGEPNTYMVTLDQQSGSGGTPSVTATYNAAMPSATMPSRTGYTFGGYYTGTNGSGTQYYTDTGASARNWNRTSATTLYAKWTAKSYTVKFSKNSGSGGTASVQATYDAAMPAITLPTRTGYTFDGYYRQGVKYYNADGTSARTWNLAGGATLTAQWTARQYKATLNRNGGSGGTASVQATYDAAMPTPITLPTRQGYTFDGYYRDGVKYYNADGTSAHAWNFAGGLTLTAQWTAKQYAIKIDFGTTVTFRGNVIGTSPYTYTYPTAEKQLETGTKGNASPYAAGVLHRPSRSGYTFLGYYDAASGGSMVYDANGKAVQGTYWTDSYANQGLFKGLADSSATSLTVYARWSANTYTVTLVTYGGTLKNGWTSPTNYVVGVGLALPTSTDIEYANHTFVAWYDNEAYDEAGRVTSIPANATGNKTVYVKWNDKVYKVSFNANGGTGRGEQDLSMVNSDQLKTIEQLRITAPQGYTFGAWNTAQDGSGDSYSDGAVIYNNLTNVANATVTLYAQWTPNPYEVAFEPNGADGGETMENQQLTYDMPTNLTACAFTRTGYAFERWASDTNYNYQTKYYLDEAEVTNLTAELNAVVSLYANWTGIVYTVTFDANGGAGEMDPLICTYTVPTNLPACTFTRDGWGFKGWTTNGADDVVLFDRARVTNLTTTAEVTLLACWTGVTYSVVLDAHDARGDGVLTNGMSVLTNSYVVGDVWDLPVPTNVNTHLSFAGWTYVDTNGVTITVAASDVVPPPSAFGGATNLLAVWGWVVDPLAAAVDAPDLEFSTFGTDGGRGVPTETRINYNWFAQADFVYGSTNAVQSADLPVNTADSHVHVSWLTTTVETNGVLSFWWKCDAPPLIEELGQQYALKPGWCGNSFTFGLYDSTEGITNVVAQLTDHVDWCCVVYTNKSDSSVTFAWAFAYADYDSYNGGGTGWVDRVTWTTNESASVEVTPTHKVPYSWLRTNFPASASATDAELEDLAESQSPGESLPPGKTWPNGEQVKVWQDYWAGTDPNDPNDLFQADIAVSNNVPYISWRPDLRVTGDPPRVYQVLCAPTPSAQEWVEWPGPGDSGASTNRFFKVKLILEEE